MASGPGRPLGLPVPGFTPPPRPGPDRIERRFVALERLGAAQHAEALFHANRGRDDLWDYMGYGPFGTQGEYRAWPDSVAESRDPFFHALRERSSGRVAGVAAFLRIEPAHGVLEIGHVHTAAQRTAAATQAIMRMIAWAFGAGYPWVEWKRGALNAPSCARPDAAALLMKARSAAT